MLTVREFSTAADRHWRRCVWVLRVLFAPLVVLLLVSHFWFPQLGSSWLDVLGLFALPLGLLLLAAAPLNMAARRDPRLVCPHCGKGLFRSRFRVFATRKCPRCDRELLDEADPPEPPGMTQEVERLAVRHRQLHRAFFLLLGFMFLVATPVGLGCDALVAAGWMSHFVAECIAVVMIVSMFALMIWGAAGVVRCRYAFIECRQCRWVHTPGRLLKTGCCANCNRPMVALPGGVAAETPAG